MLDSTKQDIEISDEEFTKMVGDINNAYEEMIHNLDKLKFTRSKYIVYQAHRTFVEDVFAFIKKDIKGSSTLPRGH